MSKSVKNLTIEEAIFQSQIWKSCKCKKDSKHKAKTGGKVRKSDYDGFKFLKSDATSNWLYLWCKMLYNLQHEINLQVGRNLWFSKTIEPDLQDFEGSDRVLSCIYWPAKDQVCPEASMQFQGSRVGFSFICRTLKSPCLHLTTARKWKGMRNWILNLCLVGMHKNWLESVMQRSGSKCPCNITFFVSQPHPIFKCDILPHD